MEGKGKSEPQEVPILVLLDSLLGIPDKASMRLTPSRTRKTPLQEPPPGTKEYTVKAEDTFTHIAVKFDMTQAELRRINRIHGSMVFPGQVLFVRDGSGIDPLGKFAETDTMPRTLSATTSDTPGPATSTNLLSPSFTLTSPSSPPTAVLSSLFSSSASATPMPTATSSSLFNTLSPSSYSSASTNNTTSNSTPTTTASSASTTTVPVNTTLGSGANATTTATTSSTPSLSGSANSVGAGKSGGVGGGVSSSSIASTASGGSSGGAQGKASADEAEAMFTSKEINTQRSGGGGGGASAGAFDEWGLVDKRNSVSGWVDAGSSLAAGLERIGGGRAEALPEKNSVTEDSLAIHCLFVTDGWGVCPGWLMADAKELRFLPDRVPLVMENGMTPYSVCVDMVEVLLPSAQDSPPSMSDPPGSHHQVPAPRDLYTFSSVSTSKAPMPVGTSAGGAAASASLSTPPPPALSLLSRAAVTTSNPPSSTTTTSVFPTGTVALPPPNTTTTTAAGPLLSSSSDTFSTGSVASLALSLNQALDHDRESTTSRALGHMFVLVPVRVIYGVSPSPGIVQPYWFAVDKEWVDPLLAFFMRLLPPEQAPAMRTESLVSNSFEVLGDGEIALVRAMLSPTSPVGNLLDASRLVDPDTFHTLLQRLPRAIQFNDWALAFCAREHGYSLAAFYRKMAEENAHTIMLLKDRSEHVFGCYASSRWSKSDRFYGNGECALFKVKPSLHVYAATGINSYYQMGGHDGLRMGGGDGASGLWVDDMFNRGSSAPCLTFANDPLAQSTDFFIVDVEVWAMRTEE